LQVANGKRAGRGIFEKIDEALDSMLSEFRQHLCDRRARGSSH
jgi:hypothetical protein